MYTKRAHEEKLKALQSIVDVARTVLRTYRYQMNEPYWLTADISRDLQIQLRHTSLDDLTKTKGTGFLTMYLGRKLGRQAIAQSLSFQVWRNTFEVCSTAKFDEQGRYTNEGQILYLYDTQQDENVLLREMKSAILAAQTLSWMRMHRDDKGVLERTLVRI